MLTNKKALVVHHETGSLDDIANNLERLGYNVVALSDTLQAIEVAGKNDFSLIVLDYTIGPGPFDGAGFMRKLAERHANPPNVIVLAKYGIGHHKFPVKTLGTIIGAFSFRQLEQLLPA